MSIESGNSLYKPPADPPCDLCGDQPLVIHIRGRCHLTAPLLAEIEAGVLTLRCYVPECRRVVARLRVHEQVAVREDDGQPE